MAILIHAGLALFAAADGFQRDAGVVVDDRRIVAVGPRAALASTYPQAEVTGGSDYLLMPGMVNSHDHGRGLGTLPLGTPDDLLEVWLPGLFTQPAVDPYVLAAWEGINLLQSGVTLTAHSHNPRDWLRMGEDAPATLRGYRDAGVRVAFHPPIVDQNPLVYAERDAFVATLPRDLRSTAQGFLAPCPLSAAEYFALCAELHANHHDSVTDMAHIQVSPAGGQWCSDELILAAVEFARQHGTRVQMHMLETQYQRIYAWRRWGKSFIAHLDEIGALGPWLTLAHVVWIEPGDLPLLAAHAVGVAHNPSSNLRLRSGVAPVPEMLAAGISLGVGLDGQALDDDQDYFRELRLAWTLANRPGAQAESIAARVILDAGTRSGATVTMGPATGLGALTVGAPADLVLMDWKSVQGVWSSPLIEAEALLLRRAQRGHVRHVMVNGRWVLRDGQSTLLDAETLTAAIRAELNQLDQAEIAQKAQFVGRLGAYVRRWYGEWGSISA